MKQQKRIALIVTSHGEFGDTGKQTGYWVQELAVPYYAFKEQGYEVVLASPQGGRPPTDPRSVERAQAADSDSPEARFLTDEAALADMASTVMTSELDPEGFDGVYLVGGRGAMWDMPHDEHIGRVVSHALANGRIAGAVCHGPAGLIAPNGSLDGPVVAGRRLTCFSDEEERVTGGDGVVPFLLESRLRELGAHVEVGGVRAEYVVRDGNLITGQNPSSSVATTKAVMAALNEG